MALLDLIEEFDERANDISEMVELSNKLDEEINSLDAVVDSDKISSINIQVNIIKSTIHMMLYNQIENTARGCIEAIYDHLHDSGIAYSSLREKFQISILHRIVSDNETGKSLYQKIGGDVSKKIIKASLNIRKEFNGNICKPVIHKITQAYGITVADSPECRNGTDLDIIKEIRNELAHGSKSFSKKGQIDPLEEVSKRAHRIDIYLRLLITSTEDYITSCGYLSNQHA
jgi:hypothetical protein